MPIVPDRPAARRYRPRVDADAVELRVLGCLIEKQRTTPDVYPLSLNTLRLACNQTTNRDPVVDYDDATIRAALERLSRKGWVRLASGAGSRAVKFRHLLDEAIGLSGAELSLLAVLMLRGAQTLGELKQRSMRMHPSTSIAEIDGVLAGLVERELAERLPRRPGQKEQRYDQLLGQKPPVGDEDGAPDLDNRLADIEERLARVEDQLAAALETLTAPGATPPSTPAS
jgi:uncharacterized protein YceH (UPF0502 family)